MPRYLYSPFHPRFYNTTILKYLLVLALAWLAVTAYRRMVPKREGFVQRERFIMKRGPASVDSFYAEVYDTLYDPEKTIPFELKAILSQTQATDASVFLDVGSGTGHLVNALTSLGYDVYGIDSSKAMVSYAEKKYPETVVRHGDILDAMNYETATFSHILCMDLGLYSIKDKAAFFRNTHGWLKRGGYLIMHLVEPKKMNAVAHIPDAPKPLYLRANMTVDSIIDYGEFKYKIAYHMKSVGEETTMTETFEDKATGHIRQNERTLYMTPLQDIITMANNSGFIPHGKIDMSEANGDSYQYIYFFVKH